MELTVKSKVNVYGGSAKYNFDHVVITRETEKAFLLETDSACGSHLHEWHISFWMPKSVIYKNAVDNGSFGIDVTLPFWYNLNMKKTQIS